MPAILAAVGETVTITIPDNLNRILGPILVGLFINWALLGVLSTQVYIYYLCFPRDSKYIKTVVYTLYVLEWVQTLMLSTDAWKWFIEAWGKPDQLLEYHLEWFDVPILAGTIASTVQIFFAWRVYILSQSRILAGVIILLALMQGASGIAAGISLRLLPSFAKIETIFPVISVWLAGSAGVDIVIAVAMVTLLYRRKSPFARTQYLVSRLIRLTIETGFLTAAVASVDLILDALKEHDNKHLTPAIVLAKMYTNSLMVVFNNRVFTNQEGGVATASGTGSISASKNVFNNRFREAMTRGNVGDPHEVSQGVSRMSLPLQKLGDSNDDSRDVKASGTVVWMEREEYSS